jgi:hypothetical protein
MRATRDLTTAGLMPRLCNGPPSNLDFLSQRAHLPAMQRHARQRRDDFEYKTTDFSDIYDGMAQFAGTMGRRYSGGPKSNY